MGGGGGGDGGAQSRQDQIDASKRAARQRLNALFGIASPGNTPSPSASPIYPRGGVSGEPQSFEDRGGYEGATETSMSDETAKNKAARDALYAKVRGDTFAAGQRGLTEKKDRATRENKFALLAQGLAGGSVDVDENALLDRTYREGLLKLGARADASRADMEGADESTRLQLLQSIDAGMDEGSAISSALSQLKVNSDRAAAQAQGTDLGDLFEGSGALYTRSNAARGAQAFRQEYPWMYGGRPRPAGSRSSIGATISSAGLDD